MTETLPLTEYCRSDRVIVVNNHIDFAEFWCSPSTFKHLGSKPFLWFVSGCQVHLIPNFLL